MQIPLLDLAAQHSPIKTELMEAVSNVIENTAFSGGTFVKEFEGEFARFCQSAHAIGVGSGTDAIWLALLALGVGPGDEVITTPMTFIATVEAISRTGAVPVFVDIDDQTYTMNPTALEKVVTSRTKAILPVHLFGQMADMNPIVEIARAHGVSILEDAAQAHGAEYDGNRAGSIGDAGCFSFYPGKNLGACGEAGAVVTQNHELAAKIRELRNHGQIRKHHHVSIGWNCRMDGIQAAVLAVKLKNLDQNNEKRREHAAKYAKYLKDLPNLILPASNCRTRHVHHVYAIRVSHRVKFMKYLNMKGIGCAIHYPTPVHLQPAYKDLGKGRGSFPVAERCADEFVSLPIYPELTSNQIERVTQAVREFHENPFSVWT